jgi:hypothetical protein
MGNSFPAGEGRFFDPTAPFWEKVPYAAFFPGSAAINPVTSISAISRVLVSPADALENSYAAREVALDNKRIRVERRKRHPFLADWRWGYRGRRRKLRRAADSHRNHAILDWYHPGLLFFIIATYVLSGIDAILTLTLLEIGVAEEANPFMHLLLAENVRLFAGVKALITGIGLVWLTAYSNQRLFTRLRVDRLIYALFAIYTLLIVHEIRLLRMAEAAGWPS